MSYLKIVLSLTLIFSVSLACGGAKQTTVIPPPVAPAAPEEVQSDGAIGGVVMDKAGAAMQDVNVILKGSKTNISLIDTTDAGGNYSFSGLPSGDYDVEIVGWGISGETRQKVNLQSGSDTQTLNFQNINNDWNKKGSANLKVVVFSQNTSQVVNMAQVELSFRGRPIGQGETDYTGEVSFTNLPEEDKVKVRVLSENHNPVEETAYLTRSDNSLEIYLPPRLTVIKVKVIDGDTGQPIQNVNVDIKVLEKSYSKEILPTNQDGETSLSFSEIVSSRQIPLNINLPGYDPFIDNIEIKPNEENSYEIKFYRGRSAEVAKVVDVDPEKREETDPDRVSGPFRPPSQQQKKKTESKFDTLSPEKEPK